MIERDETTSAIAMFLEERGVVVVWHNDWQFSVGGQLNQWVICIVEDQGDTLCIEFGPGIDNLNPDTDCAYLELDDPESFDKLLDLLSFRGVRFTQPQQNLQVSL